jgi:hypothetical protein
MQLWRGGLAAMIVASNVALVPVQAARGPAVEVALQVGATAYNAKGPGECNFTDGATIFEAPATQWAARQEDGQRNVNFTLWRLRKGGPDMLTLFVTVAGKMHRVNTVKIGDKGPGLRGSGTATFEKIGAGGVFTLDATADTGAKIGGRITCSGFTKPEDNG